MISDRIGDFIIRLKNAGAIAKQSIELPHSNHLEAVARKLKSLGFVADVSVSQKIPKELSVTLAYEESGTPKIKGVKRISKPGRRLYTPSRTAHTVRSGFGARIISTPKGILCDREARKVRAGGEELFEIW